MRKANLKRIYTYHRTHYTFLNHTINDLEWISASPNDKIPVLLKNYISTLKRIRANAIDDVKKYEDLLNIEHEDI